MKIERMNKGQWGKLRAFFDLRTEEGFVIKGFKLVEGVKGMFVGFPSTKGKDGEYYDTVTAEGDIRNQLTQLALDAYQNSSFGSGASSSPYLNPDAYQEQEKKFNEFAQSSVPAYE